MSGLKSWGSGLFGSGIASPPSDGDVLAYDQVTETWVPTAPNEVGAGGRQVIGPWEVALAADQADINLERTATSSTFIVMRAGNITALSYVLSAQITGADQTVTIAINNESVLVLTTASAAIGFEVLPSPIAVAAGAIVEVTYTSDTITNTPTLSVDIEITEA